MNRIPIPAPHILAELRRRAAATPEPRFIDPAQCARIAALCKRDPTWVVAVLGRTPASSRYTPALPALTFHDMELLDLASVSPQRQEYSP